MSTHKTYDETYETIEVTRYILMLPVLTTIPRPRSLGVSKIITKLTCPICLEIIARYENIFAQLPVEL